MSNHLNVSIAVVTDVGGRKRNEDYCGYWSEAGQSCYVLSDGAGGHGGGDVASKTAVESVLETFKAKPEVTPERASQLLRSANDRVIEQQSAGQELEDMRATLVTLLIDEVAGTAIWGHIGDSRLYLFRRGHLWFQTKDHSVFQSMVDAGLIKPGAARDARQRSVLTGSLGGEDGFLPIISSQPHEIERDDVFLMCSDGFWDYVNETVMERQLEGSHTPDEWLLKMKNVLNSNKPVGNDNYSAIAIWFSRHPGSA
jgi:PPM family protein phosphatase